ncbi:DEAD/DEAH box helicase, partial [Corynebacterium sphenisci]|uniref:DEAD/DEAH box helicase n=1 Tax=Corynebacterium sphenisci TaxID=191493 RepID=UPI0026DEBCA5
MSTRPEDEPAAPGGPGDGAPGAAGGGRVRMADPADPDRALRGFPAPVADWFRAAVGAPTPAQAGAWAEIAAGRDTLVVAPTGSGKTLAAFLWAIGELLLDEAPPAPGVRVLYISPLKALGADVGRNLRTPLAGIAAAARAAGAPVREITVGVRDGDTDPAERARLVRRPPEILITTPESLHLMLSSRAAATLAGVDTVIVDEIHALAGDKRGAHLALSLERLDALAGRPARRVGLSATVSPVGEVANLLTGGRGCAVVAPPAAKRREITVRPPVPDLAHPPEEGDRPGSVWPPLAELVYREAAAARATLVFVNSRRAAEKLTGRLNELWAAEHDPGALSAPARRTPAQLGLVDDVAGQAAPVFARAHHGSVSRAEREDIEEGLKSGRLRCVVATATLELGVDMGEVDLVVQVGAPPSAAALVQRVGRAGHRVGGVSRGVVHPMHPGDLLLSAVTARRALAGRIEDLAVPANPLDVLAQHTIAATAAPVGPDPGDPDGADPARERAPGLDLDRWYATVRRAWCFRDLDRGLFDAVVRQVTGEFAAPDLADLRPLVERDAELPGVLRPRRGAQRAVVSAPGTIADRGYFGVYLADAGAGDGGTREPRRVGELDEELVYETRVGDVLTLGASSWRVTGITRDRVLVAPAPGLTGRLPFWNGDAPARPAALAPAIGAALRDPAGTADVAGAEGAATLVDWVARQRAATGMVPDDRDLLVESFRDETGDWQVVLHCPHGRGVTLPWALAAGDRVRARWGVDARPMATDDAVLLRLPAMDAVPGAELFDVDPDALPGLVSSTALYAARFRECAARSLLMAPGRPGRRQPLWRQRLRAEQLLSAVRGVADLPVLLEAARECLVDVYDLPALRRVLADARLHEVQTTAPSPFAAAQLFRYTGEFLYEGDLPAAEARAAALHLDPALLAALVGGVDLRTALAPGIIDEVVARLRRRAPGTRPRDAGEVLDALRALGPVPRAELPGLLADGAAAPAAAVPLDIGGVAHLAHPVDAGFATADPGPLLRRWARGHGPFTRAEAAAGLGRDPGEVGRLLAAAGPELVRGRFRAGVGEPEFCDRDVLDRLRGAARRRALADIAPVDAAALARWQAARGGDAAEVVDRLAGVGLTPAEWDLLAGAAELDALAASGELAIRLRGRDLLLAPPELVDAWPAPDPAAAADLDEDAAGLLAVLRRGGSWTAADLAGATGAPAGATAAGLRALAAAGLAAPESMAAARAHAGGG